MYEQYLSEQHLEDTSVYFTTLLGQNDTLFQIINV